MKYKCIKDFAIDGQPIMKKGEIVVIKENKMFNITSGVDYNIEGLELKYHLDSITDEAPVKISPFAEILKEMKEIYEAKNHDYGNSFEKSIDEFGIVAAVVRINDKVNRLNTLCKKVHKVKDESMLDTLIDLSNYAAMTAAYIKKGMAK